MSIVILTVSMSNVMVRNFGWLNRKASEESRYNNPNPLKPVLPEGYEMSREPRMQVKKIEKCGNYKQKYDRMLVGTTENNIPFYVKQGFDKYEKTIKNFFIDNYKEEVKDGDLVVPI